MHIHGHLIQKTSTMDGEVRPAQHIIIQDKKTSGTSGGTFTTGAWRTRDLNTLTQDDTGQVTLSSNQFTLPAGTYEVNITAPCVAVQQNRVRLQNITESTTVAYGPSEYADYEAPGSTPQGTSYPMIGHFTISASKTFEVQHRCSWTQADHGFGSGEGSFGDTEIFTQVQLWKVA